MNCIFNVLIWFLIFPSGYLYSQDLIVESTSDSVNCKILKEEGDLIYFRVKYDNGKKVTAFFNKATVLDIKYGYYKNIQEEKEEYRFKPSTGFKIDFGVSKIVSTPPSGLFHSASTEGINFGADVIHYFHKNIGLGFRYSLYTSSASDIFEETKSSNLLVHFIGATTSFRKHLNYKNHIFSNISLGYVHYFDQPATIGKGGGLVIELGYMHELNKEFDVGMQLSSTMGMLGSFETSGQGIGQYFMPYFESRSIDARYNLIRTDISLVFRFKM